MTDDVVQETVPYPSVAIIHIECAGIAFRLDHRPARGEPMMASSVVWPAGIKHGDVIMCAECGKACDPRDLIPEGNEWASLDA